VRLLVVQTRVKTAVPPLIAKEYYPVAQRELRTVVGYLRFDLKELAELSGSKKANLALVATAKADVRALHYPHRYRAPPLRLTHATALAIVSVLARRVRGHRSREMPHHRLSHFMASALADAPRRLGCGAARGP